jgi:ADP-heptose:LPS heptosyltransferase
VLALGTELADFDDTAAVLAGCDLLITVDTSVAHLAGAMGRPVWLLLPFSSDWRWTAQGDRSPWYPSVRLYRQSRPDDWESVLARVARDLPAAV